MEKVDLCVTYKRQNVKSIRLPLVSTFYPRQCISMIEQFDCNYVSVLTVFIIQLTDAVIKGIRLGR